MVVQICGEIQKLDAVEAPRLKKARKNNNKIKELPLAVSPILTFL